MKRQIATLAAIAALATGCGGVTVNTDYDADADFSSYKTYSWHESDLPVIVDDPLAHERLIRAIESQLSANGLQKVSSDADVIVTYHTDEEERMSVNTTYMGGGWGMGAGWGRAGMRGGMGGGMGGMGASTTTVNKFNVGTLVLDMWDAKEHRLVWRGIASDTLSKDAKKNAKKIDQAAQKLFEKYPPTSGG